MQFFKKPLKLNPAVAMYLAGAWVLGATFLFAAVSKTFYFQEFADNLAIYGIKNHGLQLALGSAVIGAEFLLGTALFFSERTKSALLCACALLALFATETLGHWSGLQNSQCGCFGPLSSSGPGMSLLHQAVLLVIGVAALIAAPLQSQTIVQSRFLRIGLSSIVIMAAAIYSFAAHPAGNIRLADQRGLQVRAVLSATCPHCRAMARQVYLLQQQVKQSPFVIYLGAQSNEEINNFNTAAGVHLQYVPVTFRQLQSLSRQVPAIQIVKNGEIVKDWVGEVPSAAEVDSAVNGFSENAAGPRSN